MSEIGRLVSRWHWLEADGRYQTEIAETKTESERLIAIHNDEQEEIERKLVTLVPENFLDLCTLLEFATKMAEGGSMVDGAEIDMLKNAQKGLSVAWCEELKAEREKVFASARDYIRGALDILPASDRDRGSKRRRAQRETGNRMTKRKAPAAENCINPKLIALGAKLDEAHAHARGVEAAADNRASSAAYSKIWKLSKKLARMAATNLEELKLKARYADLDPASSDRTMAESIVRDLRALGRKPKAAASKVARNAA